MSADPVDPNAPAAADPAAPAAPAADPAATPPEPTALERPEWFPETLWDAEAKKPVDLSTLRTPAADLPASADAYALPTIDGLELDTEDPLLPVLRANAHEAGLGQAAFDKIVTDYATALKKIDDDNHAAALAAIGDNAKGRIDGISTWLDGKLPADEALALKSLTSDPKAVLGLERLMNQGATAAPRNTDPNPAPTRKTREEIRALMASDAYSGKPDKRDPKVIDEVTKWYEEQARLDAQAAAKP